jgi:iron(III) transport system substrate-binding protein
MHRKIVSLAGALAFWLPWAHAGSAQAQTLSTVEQIYAELAKLPDNERQAKILEGARKEGAFRFIHSLRGTTGQAQLKAFQARYPFLQVEMSELGSQDAADRLVTEESAGRHLTDLVVVEPSDMSEMLAKNLAARYPTPAVKRVLKQYETFIEPQNRWLPFETNEHGIVYNTNLVKEAPKSYEELCEPKFKGGVSFDPLEVRFLVGLYKIFGDRLDRVENLLKCLGANDPIIQRGHTQRSQLMVAGDHMASPDQYLYAGLLDKQKNPALPFGASYSTPITLSTVAAAINRNAEHPYAAALFADWSVSDESQDILVKEYRGPVAVKHPFIPDDAELVPYTTVPKEIEDKLADLWIKYMKPK